MIIQLLPWCLFRSRCHASSPRKISKCTISVVAIHSALLIKWIGKNSMNKNSMSTDIRTFSTGVDLRFTSFTNYSTATTPINTISSLEGNRYGFILSSLPNFTALSDVYEQVRVDKVQLKIFNTGCGGSSDQPLRQVMILYAYDPDGGNENVRDIFSRSNMQTRVLSVGNPVTTLTGVPGAVSTDGLILKKRFFDVQQCGDTPFFLGKICAVTDGFGNDPSTAKINLAGIVSVTCTFKGKR